MDDPMKVFGVTLIRTSNGIAAQVTWENVDSIDRRGEAALTLNLPEKDLRALLKTSESRTLREMIERLRGLREEIEDGTPA